MSAANDPPVRLYGRTFVIAILSQMGFVLGNTLMAHYGRWIEHLGGDVGNVGSIMGKIVACLDRLMTNIY